MVSTDDTQGYGKKYKQQKKKLRTARENGDISKADFEGIRQFVAYERANNEVNEGTLVGHMNRLRLSAERAPDESPPLPDMTLADVTDLVEVLRDDHGLAEGTLRNYRKALRVFFKWEGKEWWENVKVGSPIRRTVERDELLSVGQIDAMLDSANLARDKAAVAMMADCGLRIGSLLSFRVKDIDLSRRVATATANEEANAKGASGSIPLTWSRGYVANYLDVHPTAGRGSGENDSRDPDPEAALIHKTKRGRPSSDPEDDNGALDYHYFSRQIKEIGERAGVPRDKLNTHNFRKTAITRWVREGLPEQAIKHRSFWVKDSSQFDVYSGVTDEEMNKDIAAHYGIKVPENADEDDKGGITECPQCEATVRKSSRFCPGCGNPLTQSAVNSIEAAEKTRAEAAAAGDAEATMTAEKLSQAISENPEAFAEALADSDINVG